MTEGDCARKVLVVEDDIDVRETLAELLEGEGYEVATVEDGRAALEWLSHGELPCIMLLDLMMPIMNGWEVLEHVRQDVTLSDLRIAVITAAARQKPAGADELLSKPVNIERLLDVVQRHCGEIDRSP
jgi:CheY-like chemotaxis protein